ncbi:MAG TPA: DUF4397 domain-containing protein [Chitinophaga sp.]|uniref:DUF4397 domain-containing protein n=1 Tax=Chitinophaga sp. TaxID=1869181 RepID=UPI002C50CF61|nr:DUF4397 domain-containing protein [Chitinophaga sp.]HVI45726.1 DUF4397 domain-containing protein [Chitinophaga sp.]
MKKVRMSLKGIACALLAGMAFASCNKKDTPAPPQPKNAGIQLVHASPKTGELSIDVNGKKIQDKVQFLNQSKAYMAVDVQNDAALKFTLDGSKVVVDNKYKLADKGTYSLFLYDTLLNNKIRAVLLNDNLSDPGKGKTSLRFLHLSPNTPNVDIDVFKGSDSIRLVSNTPFIGEKPDVAVLSTFKPIASGDYRVKVKVKDGTVKTILDIPSVKLMEGKIVTLYLSGLAKGTGALGVGLQQWQHK